MKSGDLTSPSSSFNMRSGANSGLQKRPSSQATAHVHNVYRRKNTRRTLNSTIDGAKSSTSNNIINVVGGANASQPVVRGNTFKRSQNISASQNRSSGLKRFTAKVLDKSGGGQSTPRSSKSVRSNNRQSRTVKTTGAPNMHATS